MLVELAPDTTESGNYEIEVWQHDLDGDRPIYTRSIVLNGSDQAARQKFWMYFLPQPTDKGLPDGNLAELQKDLQVYLCKADRSHTQIARLAITSSVKNVDPIRSGNGMPRSVKLILAVSTNGTKQPTLDYNPIATTGQKEDVEVVSIRASELPEDSIGYEAVDAIIWLDGNPADLSAGGSDTLNALKDYVRVGGHLVVCQSTANWQEDLGFGDMLPVDVQGLATKSDFEPLKSMAAPRDADPFQTASQSWSKSAGPYQMARASRRPTAVVDRWIDWKQDGSFSDTTPYLARKAYGLGEVTWVAQPLTTESAPLNNSGWPYVWDQVMGWKSDIYVLPDKHSVDENAALRQRLDRFEPAGPADLGNPLVSGLNLTSKANWLIALAIVFFIVYWVIAGPGGYLYLASRKEQGWSWVFFGAAALSATGITFAVVQLVLRGPPEIKHLSFVRVAPGQPDVAYSRFGLYIPRNGDQKIALDETSPSGVSYLSPFAEHPQQLGDVTEFPSPTEYFVPVRDLRSDTPPVLTVGYRSSLKKFQARWVGASNNRLTGSVALDPDDAMLPISGSLTNATDVDLNDVYLAFNAPRLNDRDRDFVIYVPNWPHGTTYNIKKDLTPTWVGRGEKEGLPGQQKVLVGELAPDVAKKDPTFHCWINLWYADSRIRHDGDDPDISESDMNFVFPILSFWDRLPAMPNTVDYGKYPAAVNKDRVELYNRGAGMLNASGSIATGQLVVLATAKGPLPFPVQVDDEKMTGSGTVFYQFILPIDRGSADQPTTRPAAAK